MSHITLRLLAHTFYRLVHPSAAIIPVANKHGAPCHLGLLVMALLLPACAELSKSPTSPAEEGALLTRVKAQGKEQPPAAPIEEYIPPEFDAEAQEGVKIYHGSGNFVRTPKAGRSAGVVGDITLNFESADIRQVIKVILGDMLEQNYVLDPRIKGGVTIQTGRPLTREALLPTLETILRMNNAALVRVEGGYHILPVALATRGVQTLQLGGRRAPLPAGYGVRVVPLRYISVTEMKGILEPLAPQNAIVRIDAGRNLLVLAGTSQELRHLQETIDIFDVDWLAGMSVGFFPVPGVDIAVVGAELEAIFGTSGPLAGVVRVVPVERLNGLMVISTQPKYLEDARVWLRRLEQLGGAEAVGENLYLYPVQNGKAEHLAGLLNDVFGNQRSKKRESAKVAPGRQATTIKTQQKAEKKPLQAVRRSTGGEGLSSAGEVRIIADEENNTLLILSSPTDYAMILRVLQKMDVVPLQVLVEATIIEVTLEHNLEYGVRWFFNNSFGDSEGAGTFGTLLASTDANSVGGFNYTVNKLGDAASVRAFVRALETEGEVNVISAPSLMVLDNHTAKINIGDEVPVRTGTTTGTGGVTTDQIQFRDTGVVLEVTPRVNAGGLVIMDISQEVSNVSELDPSSFIDSPTISQRKISSSIAVQSGKTVVLGGLIQEDDNQNNGGTPGLYNLPYIGYLFGQRESRKRRTELLVLITPRAVRDHSEAQEVTRELRERMQGLRDTL